MVPAGRTLSLRQVRVHDAVNHSLDRCFLAARIGLQILTGGRRSFLRDNVRRRQNCDCDNQDQTSADAMHTLLSMPLSNCENVSIHPLF